VIKERKYVSPRPFNPRLRNWLNERDYTSGDWPDGVPEDLKREAERDISGGRLLARDGYPVNRE